jgi:3-oxoadipate enol-lactonase
MTARWPLRIAAGVAGAVGVAAAAAVANPDVRAEIHRLRRFSRPLDEEAGGPPLPPPLPPGRTIPVPGVGELFLRDWGDPSAPAVLLLHGWGASADTNFFTAYPALTGGYRVLALDHRGHGRGLRSSEPFTLEACADDAVALLAALGTGPAIVVGYSMGGPIALLLAHRHPEHVAGLVLAATALSFSDGRGQGMWQMLNVVEAALRHGSGDGVIQRVLREAIDRQPALEPYRAWIAGEFRRGDVRAIVDAGRALSRYDARPFASDLNVPIAVVLTTEDRLVPPRKQRALAAATRAIMFELPGDHDAPIVGGDLFGGIRRAAVDHVAGRAGLHRAEPRAVVPAAGA